MAAGGGSATAQEDSAGNGGAPVNASQPDAGQGDTREPSLISGANLTGSLRGSAWDIPSNPAGNRKIGIGEVWLKAAPHIGDATLTMEGWARDTDATHTGRTSGMLREGYLSFGAGNADFRIGKQIIVWGRADQINPTDNLTPRDNTLYIPDIDDQRFGAMAAKATYNFSGVALTGIWLPNFHPSMVPIPPTPGVSFVETVPKGDEFALKLEQTGGAMDWSVSYFRGFDQKLADYWRFLEWQREYDDEEASGTLPALTLLRLSHDHFGEFDKAIDGVNTVETQMADNDYSLGLVVERIVEAETRGAREQRHGYSS